MWAVVGKIFVLTPASNGDSATVTASRQTGSGKPDVVSASLVNTDGRTEPPAGASASLRRAACPDTLLPFSTLFPFPV